MYRQELCICLCLRREGIYRLRMLEQKRREINRGRGEREWGGFINGVIWL